ncbi:hypothetical protein LMG7974_00620 [Campylobacter majalis]|uniref:Flagellar hook-associated protein 2 n=1 Tax=Campylobacter majalis TaxID=2790656 RepID=A0ABM8Q4P0_9BACT|nr:flagellar filament capping protein FliD [Campylobacter majalis]CAD7287739.1 hypothetical protein LMG7974_00620 [Campylobacter majalis]
MADAISSTTSSPKGIMGLGSSGSVNLNDELIEKLKAADKAAQVDPITKRVEKNTMRVDDLAALKTLITNVNKSFSALNNEALYQKRKVNSVGESATVTAASGVSLQDLNLDIKQLAQRDSFQSEKFKSQSDIIGATQAGSFKIGIRGVSYEINVQESTTLQDLSDKINEVAGGDVQARIINVGGDKPYQLIFQSRSTGESQKITFSDDTSGVLAKLGWDDGTTDLLDEDGKQVLNEDGTKKTITNLEKNRLTTASDAKFTYNGLEITRDKNTIDDLRPGITVTLKETGKSSFGIVQDTNDIVKNLESMVASYNTLLTNLNISTSFDEKSGDSGAFQGVSEITTIRTKLNQLLTSQDKLGRSIDQYGISMGEDGQISFDASTLSAKLNADADDVKDFFMGSTTYDVLTYTGKQVTTGSLEFVKGDLNINGISVTLEKTDANATAKENAMALLRAINNANIPGVFASLSKDEQTLVLKTTDGTEVEIKGKDSVLSKFGLEQISLMPTENKNSGIFANLNNFASDLVIDTPDKKGSLTLYENRLNEEDKKLNDEKERIETSLNQKYETMRERWILYSQVITKMEKQFSALKTMIEYEIGNKNK